MKAGWILGLMWLPYAAFIPGQAGNPNGNPYIGQAGSTYDSAANPPRTDGVVAYNPTAPLPEPAATPAGANTAAPVPAAR